MTTSAGARKLPDEQRTYTPSPPHVGSISRCSAAASGAPPLRLSLGGILTSRFPSSTRWHTATRSVRCAWRSLARSTLCDPLGQIIRSGDTAVALAAASAVRSLASSITSNRLFRLQYAEVFVRSSRCSDAGGRRRWHQSRRLWSSASRVPCLTNDCFHSTRD